MIVIEGPDFSGKTTFCNKVSEKFNIPIVHSGGPAKTREEILQRTDDILANSEEVVIRDRLPLISDHIYGTVLGRDTPFQGEILREYMAKFFVTDPLVIFCFADVEKMIKGDHEMGEHDSPDHFIAVQKKRAELVQYYYGFMKSMPHYLYHWETKDPRHEDCIINIVGTKIKHMRGYNESISNS